jgi:hypothetical protein
MSITTPAIQRKPLRLAILNRHFWPISNSAEMEVAWLQSTLVNSGHDVDVVTIRWQKFWPEQFVFRGSQVYRLSKPLSGPFGKYRFNKALTAHLVEKNMMPSSRLVWATLLARPHWDLGNPFRS